MKIVGMMKLLRGYCVLRPIGRIVHLYFGLCRILWILRRWQIHRLARSQCLDSLAPTSATWPQLERHYLLGILKYFVKIFVTIKIADIIYCADPS